MSTNSNPLDKGHTEHSRRVLEVLSVVLKVGVTGHRVLWLERVQLQLLTVVFQMKRDFPLEGELHFLQNSRLELLNFLDFFEFGLGLAGEAPDVDGLVPRHAHDVIPFGNEDDVPEMNQSH